MSHTVISVENVSKRYRLGLIGGGTLRADFERWWAKVRGKPDPLLKIGQEDQSNRQGEYIWALRDVSFEVKEGGVLGIIGRNGAGKSTLLKILSRVTAPTSGQVKIKGRVASLLEVGTGFHPELTGRENIYLNGAILGMKKAEIERKFDEIVAFAEIEKFMDTPVKRYSSGMYVRLAFAVAAHLEPEILLVDEVLAVGDVEFQQKCMGKMHDVAGEGRTVLFVSHNLAAIQRLCSRAYLLNRGKLIAKGNTDSVLDAYSDLITPSGDQGNLDLGEVLDGAVRYVRWNLQPSEANREHHCFTRDPCVFEFHLIARRTIPRAQLSLQIIDSRGTWIMGIRRGVERNECIRLAEGIYRVWFVVPMLLIKPGRYVLLAAIGDPSEGILDQWYAHPRLVVLPRNESDTSGTWGGILNIEGEVKVSKLEQEVQTKGL